MQTLTVEKNGNSSAKAQLIEYLRQGIRDNKYRPGDRLPTTQEFVRAAGVSSNTVRLAMAELVREGTLKAIPGMGTFVVDKKTQSQFDAAALKRIALLPVFHQTNITALDDTYRAESARGFFEECERSGVIGSILPGELIKKEPEVIKMSIDAANCQGLVWLYPDPQEWRVIDYLFEKDFPIVVTRRSNIDSDVAFVGADYEKAGFDCCRRFIQSGFNKILLFNHFSQPRHFESERYCAWPIGVKHGLSRAFEVALGSDNGRVEQFYLQGFTDNQSKFVFDTIEKADKKTAVIFTSSYHLYNVLLSDIDKAKKIFSERKVAVVGNKNFLVNLVPLVNDFELYVMHDPFKEIAQCAAQKLIALIDGYFARTTTLVNIEIKKFSELGLHKYTE